MNPNANDLVKKSMEIENDFSSASHVLDTLVTEGEPPVSEYEIPSRYNKDTLRIILVNTEKYFVYWELSDKTLSENNLDLNTTKLCFKVNDIQGNELYSFDSSFALGDYYIKSKFENIDIFVKAGVMVNGEFKELMSSNVIHTFSSQINLPDEKDEVWVRKKLGWTEVIRTTLEHYDQGVSSAKYVEELERLRHFTQEEENKVNSASLIKE